MLQLLNINNLKTYLIIAIICLMGITSLGIFGFYSARSKYMYEVRGFYPEDGLLVEDPATGSLHASGAQWLISAGKCVAPYLASQGKVINRNGEIYVTSDADQEIWIGGRAEIRIKGEVTF